MRSQLILPPEFFHEEIRSGYAVSVLMKEVWAVELDLLAEAQRVFQNMEFDGLLLEEHY